MPRDAGIPFGNYLLQRRLGRGGMAEVFLARQRGPEGWGRRVAVKRILPHLVEAEEFVNMFLDEARVAARLSHPNVVHIYEFGKVDEYFFIAMEYVDGVDAQALVQDSARAPLAPELVARIGADAAAGLHHAHQLADADGRPLGLVHRDVSPQNLLVSYDGVVKLVDFGIAKATHQVERTRPGVVKGKFAYMSPEQVVGKNLDGRSDVFSLGLVLWELLAGRVIVPRDDPSESMKLIRDGRLPRLEEARPDVPRALAAAIGRALERDRERRPTAAQLGLELEAYLKSAERLATPLVIAEWLRARFPRVDASGPLPVVAEPAGTAQATRATAAGTMAQVDSPTAVSGAAGAATEASPPPRAPAPPRRAWIAAAAGAIVAVVIAGAVALWPSDAPPPSVAVAVPAPLPGSSPATEPTIQPIVVVERGADPPPPAPSAATLELRTVPEGARVRVDDTDVAGESPVTVEMSPGEHTVRATLAGYAPATRTVTLAAGERVVMELALAAQPGTRPPPRPPASARPPVARRSTGYLTVKTTPWSDVYLGGRRLGTTPLADVELPAGKHVLVFKNPELGRETRRAVTIRPDATTKLSVRLGEP